MFQLPKKSMLEDTSFMNIAKSLGFGYVTMNRNYKAWLYVWCLWASQPKKRMRVLEAGPGGKGAILKYCLRSGCETHAADIKKMQEKLKPIRGLRYHKIDLTKTKFPSGYFDIVYCVSVVEHMSPPVRGKFFKESARILIKGGNMYLTTLCDQKVHGDKQNLEILNGQAYMVPMKSIIDPIIGLKSIKAGNFTEHPSWDDSSIFWKKRGGKTNKKRWTEYCAIYEKV